MELDPFLGKPLTVISVFEPWKERGTQPIGLPLFGAITLEFGDTALLFKSPLRYSRTGLYASFASFIAPGGLREVTANLHPIVCDTEQLEFYKRALEGHPNITQPLVWKSVLPESHRSLALDNLPDLLRLYGQVLLGMTPVSETVIELRFSGQDFPIWLSYREDLDGAIQMAWAGWHHQIAEIVVAEPDCAFGWLHPDASYPICAKAKLWPNMRRYIESATWEATRGQRDPFSQNQDVLLTIHEEALRLKFEGHPQLARRFAAIRYPIVGDCLGDLAIQALHRLRAAHSAIPAS